MAKKEHYGFEIVQILDGVDGLVVSQGTIYPLLSRLRKNGFVSTTWRESSSGPPRRYYSLTSKGEQTLATFRIDWVGFRDAIDQILNEGENL